MNSIQKSPPSVENTNLVEEFLLNEYVVSPRPAAPHANVASRLSALLIPPYSFKRGGPGGWHFLNEPELHLGKDIVVPDLAGWRLEHASGEVETGTSINIAPDWACEILSPSTERWDRSKKLQIYAREHVSHVWLIHPQDAYIEVYRWVDRNYLLVTVCDEKQGTELEPFGMIELDLLWRPIQSFR